MLCKALKSFPNESIKELWKSTSNNANIQCDVYHSTKEVIKNFHSVHENKLQNQLSCQGSFFSSVSRFSFHSLTKYDLPLNVNYRKTFTTLRYGISTIPFQHAKTLLNGDYRPVQNPPFFSTPKRYSMLSLDVNFTLIA